MLSVDGYHQLPGGGETCITLTIPIIAGFLLPTASFRILPHRDNGGGDPDGLHILGEEEWPPHLSRASMRHDDEYFAALPLKVRLIRSESRNIFVHLGTPGHGLEKLGGGIGDLDAVKDVDSFPVQSERLVGWLR